MGLDGEGGASRTRRAACVLVLASGIACTTAPQDPPPPTAAPPSFENRVWRVAESTGMTPGQLVVLLSDGTLVIAATTGTPMVGRWSRTADGLTFVEDGIDYRIDVLALTPDEFRIRSHNPGMPVDTRLVPADRPAP